MALTATAGRNAAHDPLAWVVGGALLAVCLAIPVLPRSGVSLAHLAMVFLLPVTLPRAWAHRFTRIFALLCLAWFGSALYADLAHEVGLRQTVYAVTRPLTVFLVYVTVLWLFQQGGKQVVRTSAWLVAGLLLAVTIRHSGPDAADPWKYMYGQLVTLGVVLAVALLWRKGRTWPGLAVLLGLSLLHASMGFRTLTVLVLMAAGISLLIGRPGTTSRSWWVRVAAAGVVVTAVALPIYGHFASSGALGAAQQAKWVGQSRVTGGVILGARPEIAASPVVIGASPWFGQGTGFTPDQRTEERFFGRLRELGVHVDPTAESFYFGNGTYLHSSLFQQWAEEGIATVPGLLAPLVMCVLALRRTFLRGDVAAGLAFAYVVLVLADLLVVSPWDRMGATYAGWAAAAAVAYLASRDAEDDGAPDVDLREPSRARVLA